MCGRRSDSSHHEVKYYQTVLINRDGGRYATPFPLTQSEEKMAKRSLAAANAIIGGTGDKIAQPGEIKFISHPRCFQFLVPAINEKGEPMFKTDANGNNKVRLTESFEFKKVIPQARGVKRDVVTMDSKEIFYFFIVSKDTLKQYYQTVLEKLTKLSETNGSGIYTDEAFWERKNPQAFKVAQEKSALEDKLSEKDSLIADNNRIIADKDRIIEELNKKLGFKNNPGGQNRG